jgi:hypothetical protein
MSIWVLILSVGLLGGCRQDRGQEISEPSSEVIEQYRPVGQKIAGALMQDLKSELQAALQQGGPVEAVEVCHTKALPVTEAVADSFDSAVSVKRTTFRFRNPDNAPDAAEARALEHFEEVLATEGSLPSSYMQKITEAGQTVYRYYHPMKVQGVCLTCHGSRESMPPELRQVLDERYPEDLATGYEAGDFRGLIRVELPPRASAQ